MREIGFLTAPAQIFSACLCAESKASNSNIIGSKRLFLVFVSFSAWQICLPLDGLLFVNCGSSCCTYTIPITASTSRTLRKHRLKLLQAPTNMAERIHQYALNSTDQYKQFDFIEMCVSEHMLVGGRSAANGTHLHAHTHTI